MKKKYKLFLLVSNIGLFIFGLNIFVKFIIFENSKTNLIFILLCCLLNIVIAIKASFEATEKK